MQWPVITVLVVMLTGCGTLYRGLETWANRADPCQRGDPGWCGSGTAVSGTVIRDRAGRPQGTVSK